MSLIKAVVVGSILFASSASVHANVWVKNVKVTQIGTYQHSDRHYVWLTQHPVPECKKANSGNPTLLFSESSPGGKSLMSTLLTALVSRVTVDVQVKGCDIVEVYLKAN